MMRTENAWLYCQQRIAQPGSDWYYALLNTPMPQRQAILALLTLEHDWQKTASDPLVAQAKNSWWLQQLSDFKQATHPALHLLQAVASDFGLEPSVTMACWESCQQPLSSYRLADFATLQRAVFERVDVLWLIAWYVLGQKQRHLATPLRQLMLSLQLFHQLRWVWPLCRQGQTCFAEADLQAFNLSLDTPYQWPKQPGFKALLNLYQQRAQDFYQQAQHSLTASDRRALKTLRRYATLQHALAHRVHQANFPDQALTLSPIRKLLLTWFL